MNIVPNVVQTTPNGERGMDIFSRLLDDRIVMVDGEVNDQMAAIVVAQILYLNGINDSKDISLYINSPGGSVSAGMAIIDAMNHVNCDCVTIANGLAASMGSLILSQGAKDKRYCMPHAEVMVHQPLGGMQGQATDMSIAAKHIERTRSTINKMLADACGKTPEDIASATERDNWLNADEALAFGIVDAIL